MKKTLLVSLVSDQTIPNFLSIKTFTEANHYVFITTKEMEDIERGNKREWIIKAAGLSNEITDKITVNAEFKEDILAQLQVFDWDQFDEIIVNITGGTKMMSLGCYEFFKSKTLNIWYLPINSKEYHQCDNSANKRSIEFNTSVEQYLCCCGIPKDEKRFTEKYPIMDYDFTQEFFKRFVFGEIDKVVLEKIRILFRADEAFFKNQMNKKKFITLNDIEDFKFITDFLDNIKFPSRKNGILYKDEMEYLTGGWFEEYCFYMLQKVSNISERQIKLGVVLNPSPKDEDKAKYFTRNDLDVVLVNNNMLYVIECKSGGMNEGDLFNKTVYLGSALKKYFGLTVKSVLFTLSQMKDEQKEKAETLGIKAYDLSDFINHNSESQIKIALKL